MPFPARIRSLVDEYTPEAKDPAFEEGYQFVEQNTHTADQMAGSAPMWFGWMVRTAFWAGVKWGRENPKA